MKLILAIKNGETNFDCWSPILNPPPPSPIPSLLQTCSPIPTSWSAGNCYLPPPPPTLPPPHPPHLSFPPPPPHTHTPTTTPFCLAQNFIWGESIASRFPQCISFSFFWFCFWAVRRDMMRVLQVGQQHDAQELNQVLLDAIGQNLCGTAGESLISQLFHGKFVHEVMFASWAV